MIDNPNTARRCQLTATIKGGAAPVPINVDVTGAEVLELVVGDAGDGNGNDHGDWGSPTLTCT